MDDIEWNNAEDRFPLCHETVAICVWLDGDWEIRTGFMEPGGDWYMHPAVKMGEGEVACWAQIPYPDKKPKPPLNQRTV